MGFIGLMVFTIIVLNLLAWNDRVMYGTKEQKAERERKRLDEAKRNGWL
jgi:hypothetical protein